MRSLPDERDTHSIFVVHCVMRVWTRSSFRRHGEPDRFVRRRAFIWSKNDVDFCRTRNPSNSLNSGSTTRRCGTLRLF